jgi:hypothetical protein
MGCTHACTHTHTHTGTLPALCSFVRGCRSYADFQECLSSYKGHAFAGALGAGQRPYSSSISHACACVRVCVCVCACVRVCVRACVRACCDCQPPSKGRACSARAPMSRRCCDSQPSHMPPNTGIALATLPIAYYKKTASPVFIGFVLGFVPDLLYANWRCDEKYKAFRAHTDALLRRQEQEQQQQPESTRP